MFLTEPGDRGAMSQEKCDTRLRQLSGQKAQASVRCLFLTPACVLTASARRCEAGRKAQG